VILSATSILRAQPGMPPDDPDSWKLAGTAKVLCSAIFVSGRDPEEARKHVSSYFLREKLDSISRLEIDRSRKLVQLTLANRITREAKFYGDQGCVIHQPGKNTVFFKPVKVSSRLPDAATTPWPMGDLLPAAALPASLDTAKLRRATDSAFVHPEGLTAAFLVVHRGHIVAERYANGAHRDMQLESWSMGKSITGTLIGVLIQQGALRPEDPAPIPEWHQKPDDPRAAIRVVDLLRMSSGLRFSRGSPEDLPGYHDHDLIYTGAIDAFRFAVTREPQFPPNTRGRYRNGDVMALNQIIRDVVRKRGEEYLTWPQRALFDKIGIRRQVLETDPYGNFLLSGYDYGTARNWARIGMLYLNDGVWNGERLLPEGWTRFVSTPAPAWADSSYGGMVWVNRRGTWPLPRDAFAFRGAGGQETYVVPSLDLVVVRMGHFPGSQVGGRDLQGALRLIVEAVNPQPARTAYFPPKGQWERRAPAEVGLDPVWIDSAIAFAKVSESPSPRDLLESHRQSTFGREPLPEPLGEFRTRGDLTGMIVRHGYLVAEWGEPDRVDVTFSTTKSYLSSTAGLAWDRKLIPDLHARVRELITTGEFDSEHNAKITWDHLLRQTSDWEGTLWDKPDWADRPPANVPLPDYQKRIRNEPGTVYKYNDVRVNLLALSLLRVWKRPLPEVLREYLMDPIGASDTWEWHGYRNSFVEIEGRKVESVSGGAHWGGGLWVSARDHARFGLLTLNRGRWGDRQILSEAWIAQALTPTGPEPTYGFMNFMLNTGRRRWPSAPESTFCHLGNGTNAVCALPDYDMVVVLRWIRSNAVDGALKRIIQAVR
jgi:CubicO group peptidase (beta-lactamase class C family)